MFIMIISKNTKTYAKYGEIFLIDEKSSKLKPPITLVNRYFVAGHKSEKFYSSAKAMQPTKRKMAKIIKKSNENLSKSLIIFKKMLINGPKNQEVHRLIKTIIQSKTANNDD